MDGDGARAPAARNGDGGAGDGARPRRECLPRTPLPHADGELARAVYSDELDIGAFGESLVVLDQRAQAEQGLAVRLTLTTACGLPTEAGCHFHGLAADVQRLRPADLDRTPCPSRPGDRRASERRLRGLTEILTVSVPLRRASHRAAMRVPFPDSSAVEPSKSWDYDFRVRAVGGDDFEDPVGADSEVVVAQPAERAQASAARPDPRRTSR